MHATSVSVWAILFAIVLGVPVTAQRGGRPSSSRPPSRPIERPATRPRTEPGNIFEKTRSERDRDREREIEELFPSLPPDSLAPGSTAAVVAAAEGRVREDREFAHEIAYASNIVVSEASARSPASLQVAIRRSSGVSAFTLTHVAAEAKLRSLRDTRIGSPPISENEFQRALAGLDTAVFIHEHRGSLPQAQAVRYLRFDAATRSLSIHSDISTTGQPEAIWRIPASPEQSLTLLEMRVFLRASGRVVYFGSDLPPALLAASAETGIDYVRSARRSKNTTPAQLLAAAVLGERQLDASRAQLLDGLPSIRSGLLGLWDAWRMNLNLADRHAWRQFRHEVTLPQNVPTKPATARGVVEALRESHNDVLLVVAHNDGHYLYLPSGEKVAFRDIAALKRAVPPDRVVVLITCKGATPQEGLASLAEMILENQLAKSVFASDQLIDARRLPEILKILSSGSTLRSGLRQFQFEQYVENAYEYSSGNVAQTARILRSRFPPT